MGLFNKIAQAIENRFKPIENPSVPIDAASLIASSGGGTSSLFFGMSEQQALALSTVWACIRTISETLSTATTSVYAQTDSGKSKMHSAPVYELLSTNPNQYMGWTQLVELVMYQLLLSGNSFVHIQRNLSGQPISLIPLPLHAVKVLVEGDSKSYIYTPTGQNQSQQQSYNIPDSDMCHFLGLSRDGIIGLSVIGYMATSLGLSLEAQEYQARWYYQGVRPSLAFSTQMKLSRENLLQIREGFQAGSGMQGVGKPLLIPHGLEIANLKVEPQDIEILKTREFQRGEICQWFRVRELDIGVMEKLSGAAATLTTIQFLQASILPWANKLEREINRKLLGNSGLSFEFLFDYLLRADPTSQAETQVKLHSAGYPVLPVQS